MAEKPAPMPGLFKRATSAVKTGVNTAAAAVAAKGGAVMALHGLGFGKAGILAKSIAAGWQSSIAVGNGVGVVAGSPFAVAQSVGATATVVTPVGAVLMGVAVAVNVGPPVYRACKSFYCARRGGGAEDAEDAVLVMHADANAAEPDAADAVADAAADGYEFDDFDDDDAADTSSDSDENEDDA